MKGDTERGREGVRNEATKGQQIIISPTSVSYLATSSCPAARASSPSRFNRRARTEVCGCQAGMHCTLHARYISKHVCTLFHAAYRCAVVAEYVTHARARVCIYSPMACEHATMRTRKHACACMHVQACMCKHACASLVCTTS